MVNVISVAVVGFWMLLFEFFDGGIVPVDFPGLLDSSDAVAVDIGCGAFAGFGCCGEGKE
jgi:hypothetical protein